MSAHAPSQHKRYRIRILMDPFHAKTFRAAFEATGAQGRIHWQSDPFGNYLSPFPRWTSEPMTRDEAAWHLGLLAGWALKAGEYDETLTDAEGLVTGLDFAGDARAEIITEKAEEVPA